jgi:hypothetical protein
MMSATMYGVPLPPSRTGTWNVVREWSMSCRWADTNITEERSSDVIQAQAAFTLDNGPFDHSASTFLPSVPHALSLLQVMREEMLHFQAVLPWRCLKSSFAVRRKTWRERATGIATYADFTEGYKSLSEVCVLLDCVTRMQTHVLMQSSVYMGCVAAT